MEKTISSAKNWNDLVKALRRKTTIGRRELANFVKTHVKVDLDYAIWRLQQDGILRRPKGKERGLYIVAESGSSTQHISDPFEAIQDVRGKEIVFCYGTALYMHGLSRYGRLTHYYIITTKKTTEEKLGQITVRFVKTKMGYDQGILKRKLRGYSVCFTDLERTLIECIDRPKYAQGWENIMHAFDGVKHVRVKRLLDYIKGLNSPVLAAKTGIVLDHFKQRWGITEKELIGLQQYVPRTPARFERGSTGTLNKRWNVIVPSDIFTK
jgi:predicted transcriptional regulator of viral defense system